MKRSVPLLGGLVSAVAGILLAGCSGTPAQYDNHWNMSGLGERMAYHGLGYRQDLDGTYREHQWNQKKDMNLTFRRHFLNNNPYNPAQPPDPTLADPRAPHSILPNPLMYLHPAEALVMAGAMDALIGTAIPIPVSSILATIEPGGYSEFLLGIGNTFEGEFRGTIGEPPKPSEFRVKNK
ncbi:MAG: hypothetical protein O7B99_12030 [Planctomycetota bacterium]|nr:hypothetical protein [Planctomycetota bacterium]